MFIVTDKGYVFTVPNVPTSNPTLFHEYSACRTTCLSIYRSSHLCPQCTHQQPYSSAMINLLVFHLTMSRYRSSYWCPQFTHQQLYSGAISILLVVHVTMSIPYTSLVAGVPNVPTSNPTLFHEYSACLPLNHVHIPV